MISLQRGPGNAYAATGIELDNRNVPAAETDNYSLQKT